MKKKSSKKSSLQPRKKKGLKKEKVSGSSVQGHKAKNSIKKLHKNLANDSSEFTYWRDRKAGDVHSDWGKEYDGVTWLDNYELSATHPHRLKILHALKTLEPFDEVLEVGCNTAPNLAVIEEAYPDVYLAGVDVNEAAIKYAKITLPDVYFRVADAISVPFKDKSFDIVLCDAVLMYVLDIDRALDEVTRIAKKGVILVEWFSRYEEKINYSRARNYTELMQNRGFTVDAIKLTKQDWPNKQWEKYGHVFVCSYGNTNQ